MWAMQALALCSCAFGIGSATAYELVIPALEYRTGPYAPSGIPLWTGFIDYLTLLNERDGGIRGVRIKIPICETAYDTQRGVECYEKVKGEALAIVPGSTPIAYALIPKTPVDRVPSSPPAMAALRQPMVAFFPGCSISRRPIGRLPPSS
jgi:branched-chain amino acid transport system substrate-binding protein